MIERILYEIAEGTSYDDICPSAESLREAMSHVMEGSVKQTELAALLMGLRCRGERAEHLKEVVEILREQAVDFPYEGNGALFDTCGTGGDQHGMVNVSTAAALLAASAGLPVAKHGNRSVSSKSGSADVVDALGLRIDCKPAKSAELLRKQNFCFLHAPYYHPAMRHASIPRRDIRIRTIFNLAGPLSNPAPVTHQLVGVAEERLVEAVARSLQMLGTKRALVVYGRNGEDEISSTTITEGVHLRADGTLESFVLDPLDVGVEIAEMADLVVDGPEDSAEKIRRVLEGEQNKIADLINLNLGAVLFLADRAGDMRTAVHMAQEIQQSGEGIKLLNTLAEKMKEE